MDREQIQRRLEVIAGVKRAADAAAVDAARDLAGEAGQPVLPGREPSLKLQHLLQQSLHVQIAQLDALMILIEQASGERQA